MNLFLANFMEFIFADKQYLLTFAELIFADYGQKHVDI